MQFLARLKYRFDLGQSMLTIVNFCLLVLASSEKLATAWPISARTMILIVVPAALVAVWFLGWILDRAQFASRYTDEQNKRNRILSELARKP
jgi:nitrogen fixation-related uncharacterized protein